MRPSEIRYPEYVRDLQERYKSGEIGDEAYAATLKKWDAIATSAMQDEAIREQSEPGRVT